MNILGISALYHDSAAALIRDGEIIAASQEERFSRKKHDERLPAGAMTWCLEEGSVGPDELDAVVFFDKPLTKLTRLLETYSQVAPRGLKSFMMGVPAWLKDKGWVGLQIEKHLKRTGYRQPKKFYFPEHHQSHAASAFFPSPFEEAAIVTADGVGEWACTTIGKGEGNHMELTVEGRFPHSIGLLYSAFTYYTGFKVNSGEYKLMGLAPYGDPVYVDRIREKLLRVREDGSVWLDMNYFGFLDGFRMTNDRFHALFGGPPRRPESDLTKKEMDLAKSIQVVTEDIMLKTARYARAITGKRNLCMAGGVALNCVANGKILREGIFDDVWIQPASGDAGGALGAALYVWHQVLGKPREMKNAKPDFMKGAALGPGFSNEQVKAFLESNGIPATFMPDDQRNAFLAEQLENEKVVGLLQGRCEFGPRALGFRSILADARSAKMQSYLNLATKFRESFRPFAPICLKEHAHEFFEEVHDSPYMLLVDQVKASRCAKANQNEANLDMVEWVNQTRSDVPAVTHVDYSARIQTVDRDRNPRLHDILTAFHKRTGYPILVNTSFNVRSEPIVCTPSDAYRCFMRTGIDVLVLENWVLTKPQQPGWRETKSWQEEFGLD
ncbi:MAG TPA: carbamoyltransferase [Verrucomicrobiales bacterium]|nr:carbamoyltransferase [Verrucomicrobiales bacterium]